MNHLSSRAYSPPTILAPAGVSARRSHLQWLPAPPPPPCNWAGGGGDFEEEARALQINPLTHLPVYLCLLPIKKGEIMCQINWGPGWGWVGEADWDLILNARLISSHTPLKFPTQWTALHFAALFNSSGPVLLALIEAGADINAQDSFLRTPLFWAAEKNHREGVVTLCNAGCDPKMALTSSFVGGDMKTLIRSLCQWIHFW